MKIEDIKAWMEYTKSVKQIDRSNLVIKTRKLPNSHALSPGFHLKPRTFLNISNHSENFKINTLANNIAPLKCIDVVILNRKDRRKFISDVRIDLHGYIRNIDNILENFCLKCIVNNTRCITIITGKGEGIVKQATIDWLKSNPRFIIGFYEIKDSSGGSGAIGVKLRSK